QRFEIDRNRAVLTAPVMPALDRYTGVLYDGLDAATLSASEREFADQHVAIHSALFGLVRASDDIPAYRLSHNSRLPGLSLRAQWREPIATVLAERTGLILDLRSESYVQLGPAPHAVRVRVVSEDGAGRRVALTHFNKQGKGLLVRSLIKAGIEHPSRDSLLVWARAANVPLEPGPDGAVDFVV
ncbi:MAG: peroxide stress protein YaaA, partial [Salinibacterium sp.]